VTRNAIPVSPQVNTRLNVRSTASIAPDHFDDSVGENDNENKVDVEQEFE
jgi:hypothetical protein